MARTLRELLAFPYPQVHDEQATIDACLTGRSLARLGDGELKIIYGAGYAREPANPSLGAELREVLLDPQAMCIVGIPTMDPKGAKYENWLRHRPRFSELLRHSRQRYYSAFVTRPDSSPWIRTRRFAHSVEGLWRGRRVVVVCEKHGKIYDTVRRSAGSIMHIPCPRKQAYSVIADLENAVLMASPDVAILSAGPTATCLANRLAFHGVQAIDLGSAGRWLGEQLKNEGEDDGRAQVQQA